MDAQEEKNAFENLANAIVLQALRDYTKAYTAYLRDPFNKERKDKVEELRKFFKSEWCHALTNVDCDAIRKKVEKICEAKRGHQT